MVHLKKISLKFTMLSFVIRNLFFLFSYYQALMVLFFYLGILLFFSKLCTSQRLLAIACSISNSE